LTLRKRETTLEAEFDEDWPLGPGGTPIMKKAMTTTARRRAVTLVELLVVLAILSLLATLAVPVYVNKTEQARRTTARFEVREIATAEEQVALTHGYYIPMHMLDNVAGTTNTTQDRDDFGNDVNDTLKFFIDPFVNLDDQATNQARLADGLTGSNAKAKLMLDNWAGPFLNPVRVASDGSRDSLDLTTDVVLDPWGRPYLFYSPVGIVSNFTSLDDLTTSGFDENNPSNRIDYDNGEIQVEPQGTRRFDRYAIISYGADGQFDFDTGTGNLVDDVFYEFGFSLNESAFNAF